MKFDSYTLVARVFPGFISAIPAYVLYFFHLRAVLGEFLGELFQLKVPSDITISVVLLYAFSQLCRFLSKELFEKIVFSEGLKLPTTDYLLQSNSHFSAEYKRKIHARIGRDFTIELPTAAQEAKDEARARMMIGEAVGHIRAKLGKGKLVGQHNAEYGFWRNQAGGSLLAIVICLVNMALFGFANYNATAFWASFVLFLMYLLHVVFAKQMIVSAGQDYAKVLIQEYMTSDS